MSIVSRIRDEFIKIKKIFIKNEDKIILTVGIILVAAISFGAGRLSLEFQPQEPIVIEEGQIDFFKQALDENQTAQKADSSAVLGEQIKNSQEQLDQEKIGKFVGSVKSNKFHLPDCPYAKKIKDENKIWFDSIQDAESQGYVPAKCCNPH